MNFMRVLQPEKQGLHDHYLVISCLQSKKLSKYRNRNQEKCTASVLTAMEREQ